MDLNDSGKIRILLAEDSPTVSHFFRLLLQDAGFDVITAEDGVDAVSKFFLAAPHLVVSDVEMPVMNGYQVCRLVRSEPATRDVPIVLLTSLAEARYKFWGLEVGADRYVLKEDGQEKLVPVIQDLLATTAYRPSQTPELADKYADPPHILDQLNRILDDKLFRMTLTDSIMSQAFEDVALKDLARHLLEVLLKVVPAGSLALALRTSDEIQVFLHAPTDQSADYIQDASERCITFLEQTTGTSADNCEFKLEYFCEALEAGGRYPKTGVVEFFRRLSDEVQVCLLAAPPAGQEISPSTRELLEFLSGYVAVIAAHALMQERIRKLSVIDSLTHLYNRRQFMALLQAEYKRTIRHNLNLSVIFLDIDNFKRINDTYGHLTGDQVLKGLAQAILTTVRTSDVAGRYGGEEFVVYLPETNHENATMLAERLRKVVESSSIPNGHGNPLQVTVSVGVASGSEIDAGSPIEHLLDLADQRLYVAKQTGKNRVVSVST